ncbi:MAG TPA: ABC transporter substrate-binding protein [Oribacterium sp.]|nr:ABC transporter substrate-binding protein [Oribacterium sp.]
MKKMNRFTALSMAAMMAVASLTACGSGSTQSTTAAPADTTAAAAETTAAGEETTAAAAEDGKTYKIGVLQLVQHAALDKANEGFVKALDDSGISYEIDQQNASGEQSACQTISEKFVNDGDDLIYAIATPAAQAASAATTTIPIVLSAVTDPAESGLVASNDAPGGNVTGMSDLTPVNEQIDLLQKLLPDAKSVGILFCTAESNSEIQAEMAREACRKAGLAHADYTVSSSNEIQTVVESMVGKVDAIYAPTDNTIAAGMATVASVANDNKIPVICGEPNMVNEGGLATYGIDYYQLGYMAGEQAVEILKDGKNPADIPIGYLSADKCEITVNQETADLLGVDVSSVTK